MQASWQKQRTAAFYREKLLARRRRRRGAARNPVGNETMRGVVGRYAYGHAVANENADLELFHATGEPGIHGSAAVEPNRIGATRGVDYLTVGADQIVSRHLTPELPFGEPGKIPETQSVPST